MITKDQSPKQDPGVTTLYKYQQLLEGLLTHPLSLKLSSEVPPNILHIYLWAIRFSSPASRHVVKYKYQSINTHAGNLWFKELLKQVFPERKKYPSFNMQDESLGASYLIPVE